MFFRPRLSTNVPIPGTGLGLTDLCLLEVVGALRCYQGLGLFSDGLGANFTQNLHQNQVVNSEALFFQGNYRINEQWTVTAGIRYTQEEKDFFAAQSYLVPLAQSRLPVEQWAINAAGELDVFDESTECSLTLQRSITTLRVSKKQRLNWIPQPTRL
jgi:outer membrane receptor protein involved in Fe transport